MVEKGIRGRTCHAIHRYAKADNKYMTYMTWVYNTIHEYDQDKKLSYLMYWDGNILYGWVMLQKLLVNGFKWRNDESNFNEKLIKNNIMKIETKDT